MAVRQTRTCRKGNQEKRITEIEVITMGLFDRVELYESVHLPEYPDGVAPPEEVDWQTKGIDRPQMTTFRITADGRLLEEEWHTEEVPPEERPYAGRQRPTAEAVGLSVDSGSNSRLEWTLDTSLTVNVPDFRAH